MKKLVFLPLALFFYCEITWAESFNTSPYLTNSASKGTFNFESPPATGLGTNYGYGFNSGSSTLKVIFSNSPRPIPIAIPTISTKTSDSAESGQLIIPEDNKPTSAQEVEIGTPLQQQNDIAVGTEQVTEEPTSPAGPNCAEPFANQIKVLRAAQLATRHPDSDRTLEDLKKEHDRSVAKLIMLKGLKQIRSDYLAAMNTNKSDYANKIKSLKELKSFLKQQNGNFNATEKMFILEKGMSYLSGLDRKNPESAPQTPEEFRAKLMAGCGNSQIASDRLVNDASIILCTALIQDRHKEMITGFYNVYIRQGMPQNDIDTYLQYLRSAAEESRLSTQLSANKTLIAEVESAIVSYERCSATIQIIKCELPPKPLLNSYNQYRDTLKSDFIIPTRNQVSLTLDYDDPATLETIDQADKKIENLKNFMEDIKTNDSQVMLSLDSSGRYTKIMKNLDEFKKKNKHDLKDFGDLFSTLNCDENLFKEGSKQDENQSKFNNCIKNISDEALNKLIEDQNLIIEKKRSEIKDITTAPLWWSGDRIKYAYKKYLDHSTAINEVLATMEKQCNITNLVKDDSYNLQFCGINDFLPPEQAQTLGHQVEKVLDGLQISSAQSKEAAENICNKLRGYGTEPPASICSGGYNGKTPPSSNMTNVPENKSPGSTSYTNSKSQTQKTNSSGRQPQRGRTFGAGDYANAFAKAVASSSTAMSTLNMWAQTPMFGSQLNWQVEMSKSQMTAEAYQKAWLDYYNQAQLNSWTNFLGSSQGLPLYTGGVYYNFSNK